ncbi:MAG: hypothetical protein ABSA30_05700 [Candidatus Aminicenantales bacterium]|jgi:hypothetical protein
MTPVSGKSIRVLQIAVILLALMNGFLFLTLRQIQRRPARFAEIDAERINIVEKDGTLKLALFNSARLTRGTDRREAQGRIAGMLFYNEDGYECGGLVYMGKKTATGQDAGSGLTLDQYRQDQTLSLEHNESVDAAGARYDDGLNIIARPDWTLVKDEYAFYKTMDEFKGTGEQKDALLYKNADAGKVAKKRMFIGNRRGVKEGQAYDETGLFIRNKYGRDAIRVFVDKDNIPHLEFYDRLGQKILYEWKLPK